MLDSLQQVISPFLSQPLGWRVPNVSYKNKLFHFLLGKDIIRWWLQAAGPAREGTKGSAVEGLDGSQLLCLLPTMPGLGASAQFHVCWAPPVAGAQDTSA